MTQPYYPYTEECGCTFDFYEMPGELGGGSGEYESGIEFCPVHQAAPELLAALKGILDEIPPCQCDDVYIARRVWDPSCVYHFVIGELSVEEAKTAVELAESKEAE